MTRRALRGALAGLALVGLFGRATGASQAPPLVEPAELTKRSDLLGREVVVDGRVLHFLSHPDQGLDELRLMRTPVVFRLPAKLRPEHQPQAPAARVRGVLQRQGSQWWCDVTVLELLPRDQERLDHAVAALAPGDAEGRTAWARWAERRGQEFGDRELLARARALEAEAVRIEAGRPAADVAQGGLELAERARQHKVPEPEPSALAHRAFQARLARAARAADFKALAGQIEAFLPAARTARPAGADVADWVGAYARDPAAAYREAPAPVRAALDRRLWAEATRRMLEAKAAAQPQDALALADQADQLLPDRPEVAAALRTRGLQAATRNIGSLRKGDVDALAAMYRDKLRQPERAREVYRQWLDDQREHRLSPSDAEGRVALAGQYEALLEDKATAVALLRDAWKIDPASREVADAFRQRGFRRVEDDWVEPGGSDPAGATTAALEAQPPAPQRGNSLLRCTPQEVRERLGGKPSRIVWSLTQGQLIEQWIFVGANRNQYVNFIHRADDPLPKVVAFYSLPRPLARPAE